MTATAAAPRRRRRRWPVVVLVLVVVLVAAFFIADAAGRAYARQVVAQTMSDAIGVAPSSLTVTLASAPLPFQLLDGRIDTVDVSAPSVTFGPLTGALTVHAAGVPLNQDAATTTLDVRYALDARHLATLAKGFGDGVIQTVALKAPDVVAGGTVKVLGFGVPVSVALRPAAVDGKLAFTATGVSVNGREYTAQQLRGIPGLGSAAAPLLAQQTFCIASYLPRALTVRGVAVRGDRLVVTVDGDGVVLGGAGLSTKGSCPGS